MVVFLMNDGHHKRLDRSILVRLLDRQYQFAVLSQLEVCNKVYKLKTESLCIFFVLWKDQEQITASKVFLYGLCYSNLESPGLSICKVVDILKTKLTFENISDLYNGFCFSRAITMNNGRNLKPPKFLQRAKLVTLKRHICLAFKVPRCIPMSKFVRDENPNVPEGFYHEDRILEHPTIQPLSWNFVFLCGT